MTMTPESIYDHLRRNIVHGVLRPNQRLLEADLAEALGVSRTPLREGLQRLVLEGLVDRTRRGWYVHEHTPDDIRAIYEVRRELEGSAASLAAVRATDADCERISSLEASSFQEWDGHDFARLVDSNDEFHDAIVAAAHNRFLEELVRRSRLYYFNVRLAVQYVPEFLAEQHNEHAEIVRWVLARNPDRAEAAARRHVETALGIIAATMAEPLGHQPVTQTATRSIVIVDAATSLLHDRATQRA